MKQFVAGVVVGILVTVSLGYGYFEYAWITPIGDIKGQKAELDGKRVRIHGVAGRSVKLGIVGESLESQLAEYFGVEEGVLVRSVGEDTPASEAGLKAGDVIVSANGTAVETPHEVSNALRERAGENVEIVVVRERRRI